MTSTNSTYNPLLKATRAAFAELTTPEAWRWYAQQLQTGAALAQTLTIRSVTIARHLLISRNARMIPAAVEPVQTQTDSEWGDRITPETTTSTEPTAFAEVSAPAQTKAPAQWMAIEANEVLAIDELLQTDSEDGAITTAETTTSVEAIDFAVATAPMQVDVAANRLALEANEILATDEQEPVTASTEALAEPAELETELTPAAWAAPELNGSAVGEDYEMLEDGRALAVENDSTTADEIPFGDELESGPPFLEDVEEDDNFYAVEDDAVDEVQGYPAAPTSFSDEERADLTTPIESLPHSTDSVSDDSTPHIDYAFAEAASEPSASA